MIWRETPSFGGLGGLPFSDDYISAVRLAGFVLRHRKYINGIQGVYQEQTGTLFTGPWHGGYVGERTAVLFDEDEVVYSIYGRSGWYIDQLVFETSKRKYGPFGGRGGEAWQVGPGRYMLGGLFGRSGIYLDRIGFCYAL